MMGLIGRVRFLFVVLLLEGLALMLFSQMNVLVTAVASMILFSLFVQMSEGATFGLVPFVNRKALGTVAGVVGAGGNVGAVMAGFLFRAESLSMQQAFFYLGTAVAFSSLAVLAVRFSDETVERENADFESAMAARARQSSATIGVAA